MTTELAFRHDPPRRITARFTILQPRADSTTPDLVGAERPPGWKSIPSNSFKSADSTAREANSLELLRLARQNWRSYLGIYRRASLPPAIRALTNT